MDNSNNPNESNSEQHEKYGWQDESEPQPNKPQPEKRRGSGTRILPLIIGVLLIGAGVLSLISIVAAPMFFVHRTSVSVPITIDVPVEVQAYMPFSVNGGTSIESQIDLNELNATEISVSAAVAEIFITAHDAEELDIRIEMYNDVKYSVSTSGSRVIIDNDNRLASRVGRSSTDKLFINVPRSYNGNLTVRLAAGRADISGVSGDNIKIEMAAGDFTLADIEYNVLRLEMAAGSLKGRNISAERLDLNASAGVIDLAGDLGVTDSAFAAASLTLDYNAVPSSINLESAVGSANIFLPSDAEFNLRTLAVMGRVTNDFTTRVDSANVISINMALGQASIRKK